MNHQPSTINHEPSTINHQPSSIIEVVGIGLDGAAGLTDEVRQLVENATVLVGSDRHLSYFPHHQAEPFRLGNASEVIAAIKTKIQGNHRIVILVTGDPLFFGLGRLLLQHFPPASLRFHPHLTCVQLAFNRLQIPWQDARIISVHGRNLDDLIQLLQQGVEKIAILTDNQNNPHAIALLYLALALPIPYHFWVCENLGDSQEKINYFPRGEDLISNTFAPLNIVILLRSDQPFAVDNLPIFGISDQAILSFSDRPGLMTKREIRLLVLGELALQPGQIVWDIGAGTGAVSLEIARLCPSNQVYAIEKTAIGITLIEQNCHRLGVKNLTPVNGIAPDILSELPPPDRIFIGGSSGNLPSILAICQEKLAHNGVLVLAFATLEHLHLAFGELQKYSFEVSLLQVNISRSVPVGKLTRFAPLNPVTIVTASRSSV